MQIGFGNTLPGIDSSSMHTTGTSMSFINRPMQDGTRSLDSPIGQRYL
jgi:hypothetical protein